LLYRIFGRNGSGKTHLIFEKLAECIENKKHAFLIVPEQSAVTTEKAVVQKLGNISNSYIEVINFKRLCNRVFRETGGLVSVHIDSGAKKLAMAKTLLEVSPYLTEYRESCENNEFVEKALSAVDELTVCSITDKNLSDTLSKLGENIQNEKLKAKLSDIALIASAYNATLERDFGHTQDMFEKLITKLDENPFFENKTVFFDGFYGFTAQEKKIISRIACDADDVYITLSGKGASDDEIFGRTADSARFLEKTAKDHGIEISDIFLEENKRHGENSALYEYEKLFSVQNLSRSFDRKTSLCGMEIIKCRSTYEEVLCCASIIHKLILSGAKYSDICICSANPSSYEGIVEALFRKSGIPIGFDRPHKLSDSALCELILSALEGAFTRKRDSVIRYIKTGLSGLTDEEADIFEMYVNTWSITGSLMRSEDDWLMNPDGFVEGVPNANVLDTVNSARKKVKSCLDGFEYSLKNADTLTDCAKAVWELIRTVAKEKGDEAFDDGEGGVYLDLLCKCLDGLCNFGSSMKMTPSLFSRIFRLCCTSYDTGRIPESVDCVTFSDAELIRNENVPYIIVLGVNDGVFPSGKQSGGLFTDGERITLSENGLELFESSEMQVYDELFLAYSLITNASKKAYLLRSYEGDSGEIMYPSVIVQSAMRITGCSEKLFNPTDVENSFAGNELLFETFCTMEDGPQKQALFEYFMSKPEYEERINALMSSYSEGTNLAKSTTDFLYGSSMSTSYSRLEKFRLCPLSYFCEYTLRLKTERKAQIGPLETGNIIHKILEEFVPLAAESKKRGNLMTSEMAKETVISLMEDYFDTFSAGNAANATKRFKYLYSRLSKQLITIAQSIVREMQVSKFEMCDFELPINNSSDITPVPLDIDGRTLYIVGKVDRVDKYEHEGKTYIRIIDYKTGSKSFDLEEILDGLNLQMLLYLYAICSNGQKKYGENLAPAGVVYDLISTPEKSMALGYDASDLPDDGKTKVKTSGMMLHDAEILLAMDPSGDGSLIPVKLKNGEINDKQPTLCYDEFIKLLENASATAQSLAKQMCEGRKDALPYYKNNVNACKYCSMRDVCEKAI